MTTVTNLMAKRMREMRAEGKTVLAIAAEMGVALSTVSRHVSEDAHEKQKQYEKARYERMKSKGNTT